MRLPAWPLFAAVAILCAVPALAGAGNFAPPYEVNYTDSSGRVLVPGGGIAVTSRDADSTDLWAIGKSGTLVNAGSWTAQGGWSLTSPSFPVGTVGPLTPGGGIAAEVRVANTFDAFALGDQGFLWNAGSFDGTNWRGPYQEPPWTQVPANTFVKGGGLAVNSRKTTLTDAFTIGTDGCLWYAGGWDAASGFKAPFKWPGSAGCGFVPGGGIAVNSRTPDMTDLWVIGKDGVLWNAGSFDGRFHGPFRLPSSLPPHPFPAGAPVAAVSRDPTRVDVYAIDSRGQLWMVGGYVNGTAIAPYPVPMSAPNSFQWAPGSAQGRLPPGGVAANARTPDMVEVWAIAPDGAVWNAGSWSTTTPVHIDPTACTHLPTPQVFTLAPPPQPPALAYTTRLGRLTTGPQTNAAVANVAGADLGAAVEMGDGILGFFFGDTRGRSKDSLGRDAFGRATQARAPLGVGPTLTYPASDDMFDPVFAGPIDLGINNTPQDGVALPDGHVVVFLGTGSGLTGGAYSPMAATARTFSFLAPTLALDHVVSTQYFEYVSAFFEPGDGYVYIYGTGPVFRQNHGVYLARALAACVQDRSSWTYYTGSPSTMFETGESNAQALFIDPDSGLGELSVRKVGSQYVMLYQAGAEVTRSGSILRRGVFARFANAPAGFWSDPVRVWSPTPDGSLFTGIGYGTSMHSAQGQGFGVVPYDDGLAEPDLSAYPAPTERRDTYGGEYAPELISRWSSNANGQTVLTYNLSLWNPYQVDVFQSVLTAPDIPPPVAPVGPESEVRLTNTNFTGVPPLPGWSMSGGPFEAVQQCGGVFLTTYGSLRAGTMGSMQQSFVPGPQTKALCFSIWGGGFDPGLTGRYSTVDNNVSVRLLRDGAVVRESRPTDNNMTPPICLPSPTTAAAPVAWDLTEFIGHRLTLEIHDDRVDGFGFLLVSPITQAAQFDASGRCAGAFP